MSSFDGDTAGAVRAVLTCAALCLAAGCGASHVLLERPPAEQTGSAGTFQRCAVGAEACTSGGAQDESLFNNSGTRRLPLPSCPFGIHRILVENAQSSQPVAVVECAVAAPDDPN